MDARGIRPSMVDGEMWAPALQEMRMGTRSAELRDRNEARFARSAAPRGCSRLGRGVRAWTGPAEASAGAPAPNVSLYNFIIASDSKQVVNDIDRASRGGYGAIVSEIKQRALSFNCKFTIEGIVSNSDVNRLAKFSHLLD